MKEILTTYKSVYSSSLDTPPSWKPALVSEDYYQWFLNEFADGKEIPYEGILWNDEFFGPKPTNLHIKYKPASTGGFEYVIYLEIRDKNDKYIGMQLVVNTWINIHTQDATTINTVWFHLPDSYTPKYLFYIDDDTKMKQVKTQWAAFASGGEGIWTSDGSWQTSLPTLNHVAKNWDSVAPSVALQSKRLTYNWDETASPSSFAVGVNFEAPELAKTPTSNKWFYNEQDGYFYYIGLLGSQASLAPPIDCSNPVFFANEVYQDFFCDLKYRMYGEAVEANKDAITAAWGLTFEPGSLGAAIFE